MKTLIIGFGYKARRGKDTACRHIVFERGATHDVKQYGFATELREEINAAVFDRWVQGNPNQDFNPQDAMRHLCTWAGVSYDASAKDSPEYPHGKQRLLCQWWGTEYRRAQDPDYWVKRLAERIKRDAPAYAVISDLRFMNEFEFCDMRVRMDRPGFEIADGAHHISETALDALPVERWCFLISATTPEEVGADAIELFDRVHANRQDLKSAFGCDHL